MKPSHDVRLVRLRGDVFGGITAAVVALPLALAFGVASGAGPVAGLYGAIAVGFLAAVFGGTPSQVSGPTGPMTVVTAALFVHYAGSPALAFTTILLGGLLQIGLGLLRLGRYVTYVPFPVISGFMTGIGVIIVVLQLAPLLGYDADGQGVIGALAALPGRLAVPRLDALALGLLALVVMIVVPRRLRAVMPPPLLALVAGTLVAVFVFPDAPVIGEIPRGLPALQRPDFALAELPTMLRYALVLAMLGSIDTLLTSLVADSVTRTQHDSDRELIGQGIGNAAAGLLGAIPGAGATMRTVINIRAGGRTRLSGALHAIILLAVVLGLGPLASRIPLAVLAGILVRVGIDIIDWNYLRRLPHAGRAGAVVMLVVATLTVLVDLITAVAVGIIMKSLESARRLAPHQLAQLQVLGGEDDLTPLSEDERREWRRGRRRVLLLHLSGPFSFASARDMVRRLAVVAGYRVVVFNFADVRMIDTSIAMAIDEVVRRVREAGQHVLVSGLTGEPQRTLERLGVLEPVPANHRLPDRLAALRVAADLVEAQDRGTTDRAREQS